MQNLEPVIPNKSSLAASEILSEIVHPIRYPEGETEESLLAYLKGFKLDNAESNELENYLKQDFQRFVYTLNLIPEASQNASLLEIGANPYFTSILLKRFTQYHLLFTNYFGEQPKASQLIQSCLRLTNYLPNRLRRKIKFEKQVHKNKLTSETFTFEYINHNIEATDLPFEQTFDVILFCEVLEHLTNDPMQALLRIKKSLKKDGFLILTTPNVNRLENIAKMIAGANIYDPYSGYGAYGRHNREYNKHELYLLLTHLGFEIETVFSSDVSQNNSSNFFPTEKFSENILSIQNRRLDLGQYIFIRARNSRPAKTCKPAWLFRSYPATELCEH